MIEKVWRKHECIAGITHILRTETLRTRIKGRIAPKRKCMLTPAYTHGLQKRHVRSRSTQRRSQVIFVRLFTNVVAACMRVRGTVRDDVLQRFFNGDSERRRCSDVGGALPAVVADPKPTGKRIWLMRGV